MSTLGRVLSQVTSLLLRLYTLCTTTPPHLSPLPTPPQLPPTMSPTPKPRGRKLHNRNRIHIDPNHAFHPTSRRLLPHSLCTLELLGPSTTVCSPQPPLDLHAPQFAAAIHMAAPDAACPCQSTAADPQAVTHFCCPWCRLGWWRLHPLERMDYDLVLGNYDFAVTDRVGAVQQMVRLVRENLGLALWSFARAHAHQKTTRRAIVPTIIAKDIGSLHRFAAHIAHACVGFRAHDSYLCEQLFHATLAADKHAVGRAAGGAGGAVGAGWTKLMQGYLGGGIGVACIRPKDEEVAKAVEGDSGQMVDGGERCLRGWLGVYLFGGDEEEDADEGGDVWIVDRLAHVPAGLTYDEAQGWRRYVGGHGNQEQFENPDRNEAREKDDDQHNGPYKPTGDTPEPEWKIVDGWYHREGGHTQG
ncbi:hypothetical protein EDC01DRAFT_790563 [Geopyxis carbonaria]|nr:hypothetical protein EDC01DRAFT_790563 [Geopyxis carbonaria]